MTKDTTREALIERLQDEADLCRSEGASDIAGLLDEAVAALREAAQPKCPRHGIYLCGSCMRSAALISQPPAPREPAPLFRYDGPIYVRPCERGIVLTDLNGVDLESAVGEGDYFIAVRIYSAAAGTASTGPAPTEGAAG